MRPLRVTTWNVLHRVHAVNWKEAPIQAFPSEAERIAKITDTIVGWLDEGVTAVALQEVSGDQLASLRAAAVGRANLFDHRYPRLPRIRGPEPLELANASEHLVTLVAGRATTCRAETFASDPGKGFLAVDVEGGIMVIDTHVSAKERGSAQMIRVGEAVGSHGRAIVMGDFNAPRDLVRDRFAAATAVSDTGEGRPTRIATGGKAGHTIDHVVVFGGDIASVSVLDGGLLSDHNPVTATVRFD